MHWSKIAKKPIICVIFIPDCDILELRRLDSQYEGTQGCIMSFPCRVQAHFTWLCHIYWLEEHVCVKYNDVFWGTAFWRRRIPRERLSHQSNSGSATLRDPYLKFGSPHSAGRSTPTCRRVSCAEGKKRGNNLCFHSIRWAARLKFSASRHARCKMLDALNWIKQIGVESYSRRRKKWIISGLELSYTFPVFKNSKSRKVILNVKIGVEFHFWYWISNLFSSVWFWCDLVPFYKTLSYSLQQ